MAKGKILKYSISAFFPCYNDAGSIGLMVSDVDSVLSKYTNDYEIIVVDDGSGDESRKILRRMSKKMKRLKLIFHSKNTGYGGALKSGFTSASKDLVFYTDGDGQYDAKELGLLIEKMSGGVDVVQGYKIRRFDPWYRLIIGRFYHY